MTLGKCWQKASQLPPHSLAPGLAQMASFQIYGAANLARTIVTKSSTVLAILTDCHLIFPCPVLLGKTPHGYSDMKNEKIVILQNGPAIRLWQFGTASFLIFSCNKFVKS
eukprot:scpid106108/ scgid29742/ 